MFLPLHLYVLLNKADTKNISCYIFNWWIPSIFNHIDNGNKNNLYYIKETMKKNQAG